MMASSYDQEGLFSTGKPNVTDISRDDYFDLLEGHLFRAEIELHYALMEARIRDDHAKVALIELALSTIQSCRESDAPTRT